ncbi:monocarboxylate transporter 12-like [Ylistrum balloti]|uniref:monocarboxylate transporter 12-like n=1 Tax=Ylistrum balloti TaxID=509963 RepID=UPI002905E4F9|nr:monocarboxylate transporter 12-like [Ylistrum balloti]
MKTVVNAEQRVTNVKQPDQSLVHPMPVKPPDGGWGWIVTISSFFISMIVDGVSSVFGIFYPEFLREFGESNGKTQIINSVMYGTILTLAPITGVVITKYGARRVAICGGLLSSIGFFLSTFSPNLDVMILLYGFVGGFGMALLYPTSMIMVGMYFEKRRALANGIAVSGSGVGALVFAPISEFLLETYGWRGTLWIMSAVVLNTVVCASLYRPIGERETSASPPTNRNETGVHMNKPGSNIASKCSKACYILKDTFNFSLLTYPAYLLLLLLSFLYLLGYSIPFSYLPVQGASVQLSSRESALLISIIGISSTIVRVLVGYLSDKPWVNTLILESTMLIIGGVSTCCVPYFTTFITLSVYSAVYGAVSATYACLIVVNLVKLMGLQYLSSSLGIAFLCMGIGFFIGSPVAGVLSDISGDYNNSFFFGGAVIGLGGLVGLPLSYLARRKQNMSGSGFSPDRPIVMLILIGIITR